MSTTAHLLTDTAYAPPDQPAAALCPGCETALLGAFCHACGEERPDEGRVTVRRFLRALAHEVTDLDSRTLATFRALMVRPGALTREYLAGRRRPWMSPLRVYVLSFTAFVVAFSVHPRVSLFSAEQMLRQDGSGTLRAQLAGIARQVGADVPSLVARWSGLMERYANGLQLLNALLFAAACALVLRAARRDFAKHAIFSLHVMAFSFLLSVVLWPAYYLTGLQLGASSSGVMVVYYLALGTYVYRAVRAAYGMTPRTTLWRALALVLLNQLSFILVLVLANNLALAHAALSLR